MSAPDESLLIELPQKPSRGRVVTYLLCGILLFGGGAATWWSYTLNGRQQSGFYSEWTVNFWLNLGATLIGASFVGFLFNVALENIRYSEEQWRKEQARYTKILRRTNNFDTKAEILKIMIRKNLLSHVALDGVDLSGHNLEHAKLISVDFRGAKLNKIKASHARFTSVALNDCELNGAILCHATFARAQMRSVQLRGANLTDARFVQATFIAGAIMESANLTDAYFDLATTKFKANSEGNPISEPILDDRTTLPDGSPCPGPGVLLSVAARRGK